MASGRPGRLHHAMDMRLPYMNCGITTCLNRAIGMTGLSPARLRPCRPLPRPVREAFLHTVPRFRPFLPSRQPAKRHPDWRITLLPAWLSNIMNYSRDRQRIALAKIVKQHNPLGTSPTKPASSSFLRIFIGHFKRLIIAANAKILIESTKLAAQNTMLQLHWIVTTRFTPTPQHPQETI
jgi:hypothetical protein